MKKKMLTVFAGLTMFSAALNAGGNIGPELSPVAPIEVAPKVDVLYPQKTYTDFNSDLMWMDAPYSEGERQAYENRNDTIDHSKTPIRKVGSQEYGVHFCENLDYAGFQDWRLPTADELAGVYNQRKDIKQVFKYNVNGYFWSTSKRHGDGIAIYTREGFKYDFSPSKNLYIKCVRHAYTDAE